MAIASDGITTVDVFTDVEDITKLVSSATFDTETMQVEYKVDNTTEYYVYLEDLDTLPGSVRTTEQVDFTPIIPLKENGNSIGTKFTLVDGEYLDITSLSISNTYTLINRYATAYYDSEAPSCTFGGYQHVDSHLENKFVTIDGTANVYKSPLDEAPFRQVTLSNKQCILLGSTLTQGVVEYDAMGNDPEYQSIYDDMVLEDSSNYSTNTGVGGISNCVPLDTNVADFSSMESRYAALRDANNPKVRVPTNTYRMLKNIGIDPSGIIPSLDQDDLKGAYVMYGVPFDTTNQACMDTMFETFDYISNPGSTVISTSTLNMKYQYGFSRDEVVGSIGAVGTVTKSIVNEVTTDDSGTSTDHWNMYLRKQVTTEEYIEIKVSDMLLSYTVAGQVNTANMNAGGDEARLIIPLEVLNAVKMRDYYDVYENSLGLIAYASKQVYVEWYETSFFQFFLIVVVMMVGYAVGGPQGAASAMQAIIMATLVMQAIEVYIRLSGTTGGWATALRVAGAIAVALSGQVNMYTVAGASLSAMGMYFKSQVMEMQKDYEEEMARIKEANEDVEDKLDDLEMERANQYAIIIATHHKHLARSRRPVYDTASPDYFYAAMSPEAMYNELEEVYELDWNSQNQITFNN